MNGKERLERLAAERRKKFTRFILLQFAFDIAGIGLLLFVVLRDMKQDKSILLHIVVFAVVFSLITVVNLRINLGDPKKYEGPYKLLNEYAEQKKIFNKAQTLNKEGKITDAQLAQAQRVFDEAANDIAERIGTD